MQPTPQTFPVLSFLGVVVQLGGVLMLIALFLTLRRYVLRRGYFSAWATAWVAFAIAISALLIRYVLVPEIVGATLDEDHPITRVLYFIYTMSKGLAFVYFLRGTLTYVTGPAIAIASTRRLWLGAALFAVVSSVMSQHGLNEMVIWQSAIAVPALGYCASALLWLPRPRRTTGSVATGVCFATLAVLWLAYAVGFGIAIRDVSGPFADHVRTFIGLNSYFDVALNVLLGYSMILLLMEDARREVDDAQAQLRLTHDHLRRAALYDALTDSLNRRALSEGVGLEMARAAFGTVVMADIDNLKEVNDRYGHSVGDQLIRRSADLLRSCLRPYDKLYRWGGDEFLVVLPSAHGSDVLDRLRRAIERAQPIGLSGRRETVRLQVSLGAADYASSEDLSVAIERADAAMYREKTRRRGVSRMGGTEASAPPASIRIVR
jgi:diguanylate cyclase (GGDEF)-like protein